MKKRAFVYEADHINNIIYVEKESMQRAGQITNPEFEEFVRVKTTLPGYTIEIKEFPKKDKRTYSGLNVSVMQAFIIQYEDSVESAEASLRELNKKKAEGLLKGATYGVVKSWFLDKYGKAYNSSAMSKKDGKRDMLVSELLAKVNPILIDPAAEIQKEGRVSNG